MSARVRPVALEQLRPGDTFIHCGEVWEVKRPPVVSKRSHTPRVSVLCAGGDGLLQHAIGATGYEVQPIHRAESE